MVNGTLSFTERIYVSFLIDGGSRRRGAGSRGASRATPCRDDNLQRFSAKRKPVRVKKTRQNKSLEPRSDLIGTEKALAAPGFDRVPDLRRDVGSAEAGDGADAGRRGYVDLGEIAVDHVDADKQQSALSQLRAERRADFPLARREVGRLRRAAAHHVGAQIVRGRDTVDGAGELAIDQDDALVAMFDLGDEALDDPGLLEGHREHVEQRAEI